MNVTLLFIYKFTLCTLVVSIFEHTLLYIYIHTQHFSISNTHIYIYIGGLGPAGMCGVGKTLRVAAAPPGLGR